MNKKTHITMNKKTRKERLRMRMKLRKMSDNELVFAALLNSESAPTSISVFLEIGRRPKLTKRLESSTDVLGEICPALQLGEKADPNL